MVWPFLLHYSGIHWWVSKGLCQIAVPVLGGAESVPDRSTWSSLLHLSENSLFFFLKKSCLGLLLGCLSKRKSCFYPSCKMNLWFFLPKLLLHVLYNPCLFKISGQDEKHTKLFLSFEICISRLVKGQLSPHRDCLSTSQMMLKPVKHQQGRAAQYDLNLHYSSDGTSDISVGCFHLCKLQSCHLDSIHLLCIYTTQTQILLGTDYFVMKKESFCLNSFKGHQGTSPATQ